MLPINTVTFADLRKKFPNYVIDLHAPWRSRQTSRYIQIYIDGQDHDLHYEYIIDGNWDGHVELHFEGDDWETKYGALIDTLMNQTQNDESLSWSEWEWGYYCQHSKKIESIEDLVDVLSSMRDLFDKLIEKAFSDIPSLSEIYIESNGHLIEQKSQVEIYEKKYSEILRLPLSIPNYQRIYCWEENNVKCLLNDIYEHITSGSNTPYRLGTIILHSHDGKYDIIDGQQRLVTLALLLSEIGVKTALLKEKFSSSKSIEYVAYNMHLIHEYVSRSMSLTKSVDQILDMLEFSVLVLQNTSIDLAYTFFSNQNSRGVALTDYDLLKAHHLRYIPATYEQQSKHAAEVWNKMIEAGRGETDHTTMPDYARTLDTYIYRLRKWIRKKVCEDSTDNYRVKREYESAPIVEEIPPFCEKFYFNEPIQGGTHFFSFVEQHLNKYRTFIQTEEYRILHNSMQGSSNQWYCDAIESVLFGYYLKFGAYYLSDALVVIMRIILQHRYEKYRADKDAIVRYVGETELVMIIDQATSPTFFLAEARNIAKELSYPARQKMTPIMRTMRNKASNINRKLEKIIVVESFKNLNR